MQKVIFQTLEGHLRSILGTLTVEEVNSDPRLPQRADHALAIAQDGRDFSALALRGNGARTP